MCGIAGLIGREDSKKSCLLDMMQRSLHRGPDDSGLRLIGRKERKWVTMSEPYDYVVAALGHQRLSILDLSKAGRQPMASADGTIHVVYNGEVYNYNNLGEELAQMGHEFSTGTDTEVVLEAWARWGPDCVHRFNGMFAFLLVDLKRGEFWAVRDRLGIKPLYYWRAPSGLLAFASEIKQFAGLPSWRPVMNGQRAYDFLNWGITDHTEETCFAGVHHVPPGGWVCLPLEGKVPVTLPIKRWYTLEPRPWEGPEEEATSEFRRLLADSVKLRLRSDVPVGSCLSGGLDSSAVACLVHEEFKKAPGRGQSVFSAVAEVARVDESEWIRLVTANLKLEGHEVRPRAEQVFEELPRLAWHQDEPFGSTSVLAQGEVFRLAAAKGVKVMLDGQGADELLAGYHGSFVPTRLAELFCAGRWLRMISEWRKFSDGTGLKPGRLGLQILDLLLPGGCAATARGWMGYASPQPGWLDAQKWGIELVDPWRAMGGRARSVNSLSHSQLTASSLQMLLRFEDRSSMAHSVEARVPFLDYRLVERVLGMPGHFKIADGWTKRLLRDGLRYVLPDKIRTRRDKLGFATPEEEWAKGPLKGEFMRHAAETMGMMEGILKPGLMQELERRLAGREPIGSLPWRVVCLGAWMKRHEVKLN